MNWTAEQVTQAEKRMRASIEADKGKTLYEVFSGEKPPAPPKIPVPHRMNKWEELYRDELEMQRLAGEIAWYAYEPIRLKLAGLTVNGKPRTIWYTPDFMVKDLSGVWFAEVKGFWREAARVRIKMAASKYPFEFVAVTRQHSQWKFEKFYGEQTS